MFILITDKPLLRQVEAVYILNQLFYLIVNADIFWIKDMSAH